MTQLTDSALIQLNTELYRAVVVDECYGSHDVAAMIATARELEARGYEWLDQRWVKEVDNG